ncbi:MAG: ATPase [Chitinophagaceae bacterium]|nr:MAG: ATPase [Chitinophagaceae bacterium]
MQRPERIVILGPESTGKSTLCAQLAEHYKTLWVPEYAREYLTTNGMSYSYDDLLTIAKGQLKLEEQQEARLRSINESSMIFMDTNMYVMQVWCEFVFQKCHNWILDQIATRQYDLYLLCNIDLPWVKDELREYPDLESRKRLYHMYRHVMICQNVPWIDISGNYDERLHKAISAIDRRPWLSANTVV